MSRPSGNLGDSARFANSLPGDFVVIPYPSPVPKRVLVPATLAQRSDCRTGIAQATLLGVADARIALDGGSPEVFTRVIEHVFEYG